MSFDWQGFLDGYGVPYITKGANVARNHISIHCPFCGAEDPSQHLTISLQGKGWRCYRNHEHAGKNPARLISAVLRVTRQEADRIAGNNTYIPDDFMGAVNVALGDRKSETGARYLPLPQEFRKLDPEKRSAAPFVRYLQGRGYRMVDIEQLFGRHGLMYAVEGKQRGRIIFPVEFNGKLVSWTGRSIYPDEQLRYKTLSTDPEVEDYPALGPISDFLLWHDDIKDGGRVLVLCEGPFDALKVRTLGRRHGIRATCCFTSQPSESQIDMLFDIVPRYERRLLLLDRGTLAKAMKVASALAGTGMVPRAVPEGFKDPGTFRTEADLLRAVA
jgi:hypothetical protein